MGLFDDLINSAKDIINETKKAIKDGQEKISQSQNNTESMEDERFNNPPAPLPAVAVQTYLHEKNAQFMISSDFTEFGGYASSTISLKYTAEHLGLRDDITISLLEGVGDFDEIADCIEEYISSKTVSDVEQFTDFPDGKYLFKVKLLVSGYTEYFYVLRSDSTDSYDYDIVLLFYPSEVKGTNLENKLISCLDEVANTLTI